jgi:hypothetical protein
MRNVRADLASALRDLYIRCSQSLYDVMATIDIKLAIGCNEDSLCRAKPIKIQDLNRTTGPDVERMKILAIYFEKTVQDNTYCLFESGNSSAKLIDSFRKDKAAFDASYYVKRISRYSGSGPYCFILAKSYLDRIQKEHPLVVISNTTLQRLLLVAVMIATKYLEDCTVLNSRWLESCSNLYDAPALCLGTLF